MIVPRQSQPSRINAQPSPNTACSGRPARRQSCRTSAASDTAPTLIETAKLNAVDPHAWLADTLARIPDYKITKVDDLLPWKWNR